MDSKKGVTFAVSSEEDSGEHAGRSRFSTDCSDFAAGNNAFGLPTISGCVIEQAVQAVQPNLLSREGSSLLALNSSTSGRPSIALQHSNTNPLLRRLLDPDYSFSAQNSGDLPSPMGGSGCRRPRRFEVEGDDRSSFLFNDDEDRWVDQERGRLWSVGAMLRTKTEMRQWSPAGLPCSNPYKHLRPVMRLR